MNCLDYNGFLAWIIDHKNNKLLIDKVFKGLSYDEVILEARQYIIDNKLYDKCDNIKIMIKDNREINVSAFFSRYIFEDTNKINKHGI